MVHRARVGMSGAEEGAGYGATQEQALPEFGSTQQPADAVGGDGGELPRRDLHLRFLDARGSSRPSGIAGWYLVADGAGVRVGRDGRCDVVLAEPYISATHAKLRNVGGALFVSDLSAHGTFVDGERLPPPRVEDERRVGSEVGVRVGSTIAFGETCGSRPSPFVFAVGAVTTPDDSR